MIGVDLGTSTTKVALQTPTALNQRVFPAPLNTGKVGLQRYLLPTRVHVGDRGISLDAGDRQVTNLKLRLIEEIKAPHDGGRDSAAAITAGYLALVLRRATTWFLETKSKYLPGMTPRWHVNLGIPSAGYDDAAMRAGYAEVLRAAWYLAQTAGPVTTSGCTDALRAASDPTFNCGLPADSLAVVPEVAAEVVGYAKSTFGSEGLHVLVDVGAATMDICGFILQKERTEAERYNLLTAEVAPLGAFSLHRHRVEGLRALMRGIDYLAPTAHVGDAAMTVPDSVLEYLRAQPPADRDRAAALRIEQSFAKDCEGALARTITSLRRDRDPRSPKWREGLSVFVTGGGSRLKLYAETFQRTSDTLKKSFAIEGLNLRSLSRPPKLECEDRLTDRDFDFLAVAYGLSFDRFDIGEIRAPSTIANIPRAARRDYSGNFVDKDQV